MKLEPNARLKVSRVSSGHAKDPLKDEDWSRVKCARESVTRRQEASGERSIKCQLGAIWPSPAAVGALVTPLRDVGGTGGKQGSPGVEEGRGRRR